MISIIITAFKEPKTIGKAIESILKQKTNIKYELLVFAPDKETLNAAKKIKDNKLKIYQDEGKGKPSALNIAFKKAKGNILILTDGDVYISDNSINEIIKPFKDKKIGAVSGRPMSLNPRNNMLGYFSHLLTDEGAHETRLKLNKENKYLICSGYLMAIRNKIIKQIPEVSLADDAVISNLIYLKNYKIKYTPEAKVYVKFPTTLRDWIKQKRRSAGGYSQMKKIIKSKDEMRSFIKESKEVLRALKYPKTIKEIYWTLILIILRLYLWLDIFINIKLRKQSFSKIWNRIESTK